MMTILFLTFSFFNQMIDPANTNENHFSEHNYAHGKFNMTINEDSLSWSFNVNAEACFFIVEKYEFESWNSHYFFETKSWNEKSSAKIPVYHHSGHNLYRVKFVNFETGDIYYSTQIDFRSKTSRIKIKEKVFTENLVLPRNTFYKIANESHEIVLSGVGYLIFTEDLLPGKYYLLVDNKVYKFRKRDRL